MSIVQFLPTKPVKSHDYRPFARGIRRNISFGDDISLGLYDILYRKTLLVPKNSFNFFVRFINHIRLFGTSHHFLR